MRARNPATAKESQSWENDEIYKGHARRANTLSVVPNPGPSLLTSTMDSSQQTLRVRGLSPKVDEEDITQWFGDRIQKSAGKRKVQTIGRLCYDPSTDSCTTTVTFSSNNTAQQALKLGYREREFRGRTITLDCLFDDITTLHKSVNPRTGKTDVE